MTTDTAADILDVTPSQIYKLIKKGVLRARKLRVVPREWSVNGQDVQRERRRRNKKIGGKK